MTAPDNSDRFLDLYERHKVFVHIVFWLAYLLVITILSSAFYTKTTFFELFLQLGCSLWIDVAATYFTAYYLLPRLLLKKKYVGFAMLLLLSAIFFILMQRVMQVYVTFPIFYPEVTRKMSFFDFNPAYSIVNIYAVVGIVTSARLFKYWFFFQRQAYRLENEKLEAELKYLKSQIHPHFLFNTLNNLYALTLDKSDLAPRVVIRLSELLSYMLYDANAQTVPLQKEIDLIENYLELENLRRGGDLRIDWQKTIDQPLTPITPLLFIPFIENSFKHGVWNDVGQPEISISLVVKNNALTFDIQNSIGSTGTNKLSNETEGEGIGLRNVKRRLEILYPNQHSLEIKQNKNRYQVTLVLNLMC
ncbi:MAG: histidine kinase [Bacteroidales bacterium]|nr:histidine kinase [Bacteroidales bacterium]MDD2322695.1 histidine kinase [Bacteroidales bacterium]MDD3010679.1 histidine kinase [Bacteroidales bacterium]MDD3961710.1 histidine kinase [Bacteroidales bacterium]MDY0285297.1 histidine kinase [Bacteroidales bacterium]